MIDIYNNENYEITTMNQSTIPLKSTSKMEGLIQCKMCLADTPKCQKFCRSCNNELGDRCWRCNHLGKPNSKYCFKCNVKLDHITMPSYDSIAHIPPFKGTLKSSNNINNNQSPLATQSPSSSSSSLSSNNRLSNQGECGVSMTSIPPIRSIIENINKNELIAKRQLMSPLPLKRERSTTTAASFISPPFTPIIIKLPSRPFEIIKSTTTPSTPINITPLIKPIETDNHYNNNNLLGSLQEQNDISSQPSCANNNNMFITSPPPSSSTTPIITITPSKQSPSKQSPTILSVSSTSTTIIHDDIQSPISSSCCDDQLELLLDNQLSSPTSTCLSIEDGANITSTIIDDDMDSTTATIPIGEVLKRKSFNGVDSNSVLNEIIDAFPTPPTITSPPPSIEKDKKHHNHHHNSHHHKDHTITILHNVNGSKSPPTLNLNGSSIVDASLLLSPKSKSDHRTFLIKEIISTELDYINDLDTTIQVFYKPLRDQLKLITNEECASVFSNIQQLYQINKDLYEQLITSSKSIGEIFSIISDKLDVYSVYCNYHQKSLESLNNLLKLPQVEYFFNEIYLRPELRGMNLHSFLIKPVQRICKYPLLLRELLKATPIDHCDHSQLLSAVSKIEQIVNTINKEKMEMETWQRTMQIIQSLKGAENLQLSKRQLVSEGNIQLVEGYIENTIDGKKNSAMKYKKGFYFLFDDLFLFTKQKGNSYKLVLSIPLDTILIHGTTFTDKQLFTLIEIGIGGQRWTFLPQSKAVNQMLLITIQKLIEKNWEGKSMYDRTTLSPSSIANNSPQSPNIKKKKMTHRLVKSLVNMKAL